MDVKVVYYLKQWYGDGFEVLDFRGHAVYRLTRKDRRHKWLMVPTADKKPVTGFRDLKRTLHECLAPEANFYLKETTFRRI